MAKPNTDSDNVADVKTPAITLDGFNAAKDARNVARERLSVYFDTFEVDDVDALLALDAIPPRVRDMAEAARDAMAAFQDAIARAPADVLDKGFTSLDKRDSFNVAAYAHTEAETELRTLRARHAAETLDAYARFIPAVCATAGFPAVCLDGMGIPTIGVINVASDGAIAITPHVDANAGKRLLRIGYARGADADA